MLCHLYGRLVWKCKRTAEPQSKKMENRPAFSEFAVDLQLLRTVSQVLDKRATWVMFACSDFSLCMCIFFFVAAHVA